jgi:hypothetical protein
MGDYTKYLRLIKPGGNDYYNVDDFNQNSELIDEETEKLNNAVTKIQEGATREKAGIVQFGTEEGKALEGMMLARLAGCVAYGGDIQDEGVKDVNYLYYDRNTRKMYKCINQNNNTSANVANFIPLDNNSLGEKIDKLYMNMTILFYKGGALIPNGTSVKLPDYITYNNITSYYFEVRFYGGISLLIRFTNSTNTNIVKYKFFNDIEFELDTNTNILKVINNANQLLTLTVYNNLTQMPNI